MQETHSADKKNTEGYLNVLNIDIFLVKADPEHKYQKQEENTYFEYEYSFIKKKSSRFQEEIVEFR